MTRAYSVIHLAKMVSELSKIQESVDLSEINQAYEKLENLQFIRKHIQELNSSKGFCDKKRREKIENDILHNREIYEKTVQEIKGMIQDISQKDQLKSFGTDTILLDQKNAICVNLSVELSDFRQMELEQHNKEKKELKDHLQKINPKMSDTQIEEEIESKRDGFNNHNLLDSESERRFKRLSEMIKSVEEINILIKEISEIVESDADMIDQIEIDVSATKTASLQTNVNLQSIRAKKRRWRIIKTVSIAILAVLIIILIAYLFNTFIAPFLGKSKNE